MTKNLIYSFIRTDADGKITLFLNAESSWLTEELDFQLTTNKELILDIASIGLFKTNELEPLLYESLSSQSTLVVFCDKEANFMAECILEPLEVMNDENKTAMRKNKP